ncbi:PDZ domain-containing protein 8-like, partial [Limulus polyphemus]|uniref:PDZ domain-containing protein 8-like n=1 Tax=Limulus polyphemus TaxID=6850 RepID=A0ABM1T224_LIMPO
MERTERKLCCFQYYISNAFPRVEKHQSNEKIRDLQLGSNIPVIKNITVNKIQLHELKKTIEEIDIAFELEYKGGFQLSLDVEMVLRHSAFLSVQMTQLKGLMCLQLTRFPYTHWSCSFFEEPVVNFGVESHFQGRSVPQVTSLIITQIRKMLRKKHTLPNYKMRIKPFFPLPDNITTEFKVPSMDKNFEGSLLEVTVLQCTRLHNIDQSHKLCCTLAVDCSAWIEVTCSQGTSWTTYDFEVVRKKGQQIGILFRQEYLVHRQENCVVVEAVIQNLPAAIAGIKKNDVVITVNDIKVTDSEHTVRVFKQVGERFSIRVQRQSVVQETRFLQEKPKNIVSNTEVLPE